jgi:hypothetical protein
MPYKKLMKNILDLNSEDAKEYFLKGENYSRIELPSYFSFQKLIDQISKKLIGKELSDFRKQNPREYSNVNYSLVSNKDGKYAWRPLQLIHPAIYVSLVHSITSKDNWDIIKKRFEKFRENQNIECHSLPVLSEEEDKTDKFAQILTWWHKIEQNSLALALDYKYVHHTDITDCYGSIYTHSISWALHTKRIAKKRKIRTTKSLVGVSIDNHLQDMNYGQTNGIPQGSSLMDFIAEIVLGYVDLLLARKLKGLKIKDYKILRYRDDYRIFTNNSFLGERITKELSETLSDLGLRLNADKTEASDDIIKSSIKPDKRYWISNKRTAGNKQKWLIQLHLLSEIFPNSGTLDTQMRDFLKVLENSKKKDTNLETLISIVTEIGIRNPRVIASAIAIVSIFLSKLKTKEQKIEIADKIQSKFEQVPNSSLIMIWFQRLYLKLDKKKDFEEQLCKKVVDKSVEIWNSDWLDIGLKSIIEKAEIVDKSTVDKAKVKLSTKEIKKILKKKRYHPS